MRPSDLAKLATVNRNPLLLPRNTSGSTRIIAANILSGGNNSGVQTFWDIVNDHGAYIDNTGFVVDTFREIVNITGSGYLTSLISAQPNTSANVTFRVTVDGVQYTFPAIALSGATARLVVGVMTDRYFLASQYAMAALGATFYTEGTVGARDSSYASADMLLVRPEVAALQNLGVRFDSSLVVEVAYSAALNAGTPAYHSGALYVLDS